MASNMDKDTLNQALDHIHRTASCADSLTTFNEFAPPPSSSGARDGLGITGDLQGSLSGLYSRLKATVGGSKDVITEHDSNADGADDTSSLRSVRTTGSTPASSLKYGPRKKRNQSPAVSNLSLVVDTHDVNAVGIGQASVQTPKADSGREHAPGKSVSNTSNSMVLNDKPLLVRTPTGLKPFTTPVIGAGGPTVSETKTIAANGQRNRKANTANVADASNNKPLDAIEVLRATDRKVPRPKSIEEQFGTQDSDSVAVVEYEGHPPTLKTGVEKTLSSGRAKAQPINLSGKFALHQHQKSDSPLAHQDRNLDQQKPKNQEIPPFPGLVRGHSSTSIALTTASTMRQIEESEEALHAVGRLPSHLEPKLKHAKSAGISHTSLTNKRNRVLSREYWMRDENAKDCFYCGDAFTTWRRKHHCRTCGQIFDAKCTTLVNGAPFGQPNSIRLCKPCESIVDGYDDSSEFSDDGSISSGLRPRHGSSGAHDISPARSLTSLWMNVESKRDQVPMMTIPTRRLLNDNKRRSAVLEIDAEPRLQRPGSSRSSKPSLFMRSHPPGHRRHHSKPFLQRGPRIEIDEPAPFHFQSTSAPKLDHRLPAFHSDSVIDPELAAYLSDEDSSGNEQLSLAEALSNDVVPRNAEFERNGFPGLNTSSRRRPRLLDKSISGVASNCHEGDNASINSARLGRSRSFKRRTRSISSNLQLRASPTVQRYGAPSQAGALNQDVVPSLTDFDQMDSPPPVTNTELPSISDPSETSAELNNASIQHIKRMLLQLLRRFHVGSISKWEKVLLPIILQASNDVIPDVQNGDAIDIRHYIKLKKIPGGRPSDSTLVSGLVFTKNLALKSMPRSLPHPNILILTFPLEYARHQKHFMSLEPVIRQEREYLQNLVHRIAALQPHLLLVHQNISGLALQYLEEARIATAYNVKLSVLEAVSRFAKTRIISSMDKLAIKPAQAGKCAAFYLKTYKYKQRKKTYMYLSGCPKELGCTVVLRGGEDKMLSHIKKITEFMIYVTYNLKLETSFLRDEFLLMPSYEELGTIMYEDEAAKKVETTSKPKFTSLSMREGPTGTVSDQMLEQEQKPQDIKGLKAAFINENAASASQMHSPRTENADEINLPDDVPMPTFYGDMIEQQKDRILSCSPFVRFRQPYLVMRAREQERRLAYLKQLRDQDNNSLDISSSNASKKFMLVTPDMIHGTTEHAPPKVREVIRAVQDAEYDKAVHNYRTQKKQWEAYVAGSGDMFDPLLHQNITVLYSVICATTSIPCVGPDVLALGFYNEHEVDEHFDADVTLGQYVEDLCLGAKNSCIAQACDRTMLDHHRQYVHGEAQLSITVEPQETRLPGFEDVILMWSICRICSEETPVIPMSDSTWKYSFGKYLELSFWSNDFHSRAGACQHDLHRDYHRCFGVKDFAVRVQYDPVTLLEIIVPRTRMTWKVTNDLRFKNEVFLKAEERITNFMNSVKARIKSIKLDSVIPEKTEECKEEVDRLSKLAYEHHVFLIEKLQEKYMGSHYYEIVPFNRAIRALQEKVVEWDSTFAEFDRDFFPSDRDIRRLATLQLKKIFLDREDSISTLSSTDEKQTISMTSSFMTDPSSPEEPPVYVPLTRQMSPEKAEDMLAAVVENHLGTGIPEEKEQGTCFTTLKVEGQKDEDQSSSSFAKDVQHLDLAVPEKILAEKVIGNTESPGKFADSDISPDSQTFPSLSSQASPVLGQGFAAEPSNIISQPSPDAIREDQTSKAQSLHPNERVLGHARASDDTRRKSAQRSSIPLYRTRSQPTHLHREKSSSSSGHGSGAGNLASFVSHGEDTLKYHERKQSDRAALGPMKSGINSYSMIPRSIANRRKESKVSTLAKHFEELSREFERERLHDRKQRASKARQVRAYPVAASRPIIEEYRNFYEAVDETDPSDEQAIGLVHASEPVGVSDVTRQLAEGDNEPNSSVTVTEGEMMVEDTATETTENEGPAITDSRVESSDEEDNKTGDTEGAKEGINHAAETQAPLNPVEAQLDLKLDLPKHEKSSLMKMLTNFWAERSASGWQPLEYPLNPTDHIFEDSDIIIREDEPSSLVAFALNAADYKAKLVKIQAKSAKYELQNKDYVEDLFLNSEDQARIERSLLQSTGTHLKYQFQEGSARMLCKIFYAEQFDAVRRKCGIDFRFIESLSRCLKWDSKGGKTKSVFLKTLDDRLVLKSLSQIETQAFLSFAPSYFTLMGEALFHELPSVIAKMVGFYQIIIKNPATGVEFNWFLLVMENLFYDRAPTRIFDLKGSMRNRRIQSTGERNEVLLDENMVEYIYEKPLFAREHSKRLLRASVYNDTLFLARQNVMDYSLMVAIDEQRKELVVGIIDCIRTYTWDKKLESWMKDRGKNRPTVTSPKEYKNRFREAMSRYVLQAPTCWHQFKAPRFEARFERVEETAPASQELPGELEAV
ncbi:MAG: hypothetical protein LQ340_004700 [Diploschistes diacapsis]|nr:MAG: hypothetical protein LQ340_004700 [Diploschistes diacapsis]